MRPILLAGAAALALGGGGASLLWHAASAQPPEARVLTVADAGAVAPAPAADTAPDPGAGGPAVPAPEGAPPAWHGRPGEGGMGWGWRQSPLARAIAHWRHQARTWTLVYPAADRKLDPADVQKIAEAFLLWRGNHSWKVVDVAAQDADDVGFAVATPDGSVIARFTMNRHTGRVTRTG
ncbi:MAG TPA: hypothetical protein VME92_13695 [Acetobacteraceae bacterium]|nr:hypothetical protein [Acetobacteraceae bacterium]